jgi:hypothetical protein
MDQSTTLNQNVLPFWTRTKNGYPKFLIKGLRVPLEDLMKDLRFRQGLLTICNFYKTLKAPVSYDLSTITQVNPKSHTSEYCTLIDNISNHFKNFLKLRFIDTFQPKSDNPVFLTPKASANGPNALGEASILDAIAICETGKRKTLFEIARSVFPERTFKDFVKLFRESLSVKLPSYKKKLITGRLHFLQEGGGKTRVICIPDIWSQCVLKPIHDYLYQVVLKKLPCDGTFSHSNLAKRVRKYTKTGGLTCYDLKAATDRMPVDLQQKIMNLLIGDKLSSLWRSLLCDRDYHVKENSVRYAVGQPMGFLTSWASMAITHHAIINYAKKDKSFYGVIGDDVAIASKHGAEDYKNILDVLGMEISKEKSIHSTDNLFLGELAKRLFINGGEISPIPPDIIIKSTGTIIGFLEFIRVFSEKLHHTDLGGFSDSEYQEVLNKLFLISLFKNDHDALVLLSCPILDSFPILPPIPPLKEVRSVWRTDLPKVRLLRDFEQFLLELANNRTNEKVLALSNPNCFVESKQQDKYPIFEYAKLTNKVNLTKLIKRINTTYVDEEADSFAEGPIKDIRDILSYPNPLNDGMSKTYLSKRKLRLRNTHSVIQLFLDVPRYKAMYYLDPGKSTKPSI